MANDENDKVRRDLEEKLKIVQKELKEKCDQCDSVTASREEDVKIVEENKNKIKELETQIAGFQSTIEELKTKNDTSVSYVENKNNDLFDLNIIFDMGKDNDKKLSLAAGYLEFLVTGKYSAEDIKKEFYHLEHLRNNLLLIYKTLF
jgi:chromosome segregation ATPase